ncbi:MAG: glycoside hydrolase family 27 protein [Prevotella sp.]
MGWMSWNLFSEHINEQLLREMADAMVSGGYRDAGYEYLFIDDCWQGGRDNRNNLIPDPEKFPSGIKALADYVHARGLKLGIYSDAAQLTCAGRTASYGFEEQDARTFASWGIDYLKYDYCNAPADSAEAHRRYKIMGDALAKSGRRIALGVCEWGQLHPELWAAEAGGTVWRTTYDVRDMWVDKVHQGGMGILDIVNVTAPLYSYARPGHWNDMDMLVVGLEGRGGPSSDLGGTGCTYTEYQSQMSLWCMEASPLAMTHDLRSENAETRRILLNKEIIAINQDALGKAAERKVYKETYQVFVRPLTGNRWAVAVLNTAEQPQVIRVDFSALGIAGRCSVRDVWAHKQIARKAASWKGRMAVHETKVFVLK